MARSAPPMEIESVKPKLKDTPLHRVDHCAHHPRDVARVAEIFREFGRLTGGRQKPKCSRKTALYLGAHTRGLPSGALLCIRPGSRIPAQFGRARNLLHECDIENASCPAPRMPGVALLQPRQLASERWTYAHQGVAAPGGVIGFSDR